MKIKGAAFFQWENLDLAFCLCLPEVTGIVRNFLFTTGYFAIGMITMDPNETEE